MSENSLESNFKRVLCLIKALEERFLREPDSVRLLAASKGQLSEHIRRAYELGHKVFGENYLQEALNKIEVLRELSIDWHFIGSIQSNKTRDIANNFNWVHSVERVSIAKRLNDQRSLDKSKLNVLVQVNVDEEPSKSGVTINNLSEVLAAISKLPRLKLRGLMAIPKPKENFSEQRQSFQIVRELQEGLNKAGFTLDTLSMGMSNDFEAAVAEGATIVRIGSALFGSRQD